jgi:hypothetical protein
MIPFCFALEL